MRQLILKMSVSVDGFVGTADGGLDWIFKTMDDGATAWTMESLAQAGVHIMGSRTFHDMAAHWPRSTEPYAAPMNDIPKLVFSKNGSNGRSGETTRALRDAAQVREERGERLAPVSSESERSWNDAKVLSGDLSEEIGRLKQESGKDILAHGGARFAQSLVKHGLVDEYRLLVHPVALGTGLPLFSSLPERSELRLLQATRFPRGAVAHVYRAA
ncbi:MAG TPA: dihydrofolate reductase family protein [Polyangiales bacterium]|nr:dihydrofolate reductase family protein [Polyangiales bacterium]